MTTTYFHHDPHAPHKGAKSLKERVIEHWGTKCHWCGQETLTKGKGGLVDRLRTLEHLIRQADGGKSNLENCRIACKKCNNERHHQQHKPPAPVSAAVGNLFIAIEK